MARLSVSLLGPPRAERDGVAIEVDTRKAIALLAYLAVTGGAHRRDALAALLWPDYDQEHARGALRRTLSALNKSLAGGWLVADRATISLAESDLWLDVVEFRRLLGSWRPHGHAESETCPSCIEPLTRAASLYRGDFLAGFALRDSPGFDEWQLFEAETLRSEFARVLSRLARAHAAYGDLESATQHARRWLAMDPLHEPAHQELIRLYASMGQRAAAVRQYRECVRILERELGVAPLAETTDLYEAAAQGELGADGAGTPPPDQARLRPRAAARVAPQGGYPLVGRDEQWRVLDELYESIESDGRLVVVEGEAGIGKTRLAEEFLRHVAARGAATLAVRAHEGESGLAYALFVEGLRNLLAREPSQWLERASGRAVSECVRLVPELADLRPHVPPAPPLDSPGARLRFFEGVVEVLTAGLASLHPGVLLFDDLQWADEASLDVLVYLVRRLRGRPILIIATWRREEVPEGHRLAVMAGEARRAGTAKTVSLSRLGREDVARLVEAAAPGADGASLQEYLYRETEGVPFFLVEYLAALERDAGAGERPDWLPRGVGELLRVRVGGAGETSRQILGAAAVIGTSFDLELLQRVSGRSDEETIGALEELTRRGLLKELGEGTGDPIYDFSHQKVREFVYAQSNRARRRLLHRRAAETLRGRAGDASSSASLVAHHLQQAGREQEAASFFKLAGERARSLFANSEAIVHFNAALASGHADTASLHEAIGDLHTLNGDYAEALVSYEAAAAQAGHDELARIEHKIGGVHHRRGDWELAETHFEAAARALRGDGAVEEARLLADRSLNSHRMGRLEDALIHARRALDLAEAAGDVGALAQTNNILGVLATSRGDLDRAREHLQKSLLLSEDLTDPSARVAALNNLALVHRARVDLDEAVRLTEKALALCASQGDRHREAALHNNLADLLQAQGRSEQAMPHLKQAVSIFAEIGEPGAMEPEIWKLVEW